MINVHLCLPPAVLAADEKDCEQPQFIMLDCSSLLKLLLGFSYVIMKLLEKLRLTLQSVSEPCWCSGAGCQDLRLPFCLHL